MTSSTCRQFGLYVVASLLVAMLGGCGDDPAPSNKRDTTVTADVAVTDLVTSDQVASDAQVCTVATDCPNPSDPCSIAQCQDGFCAEDPAPDGASCDDGDKCTANDVCTKLVCAGTPSCECQKLGDCADKNDTNPCTPDYYCDVPTNSCKILPASVVTCPTTKAGVCLKWGCDKTDGVCRVVPDDTQSCEDDSPCAAQVACKGGQCVITKNTCSCKTDLDCAAQASGPGDTPGPDDDNLCNGVYFCDKAVGHCAFNAATVVKCSTFGATDCFSEVCDPKSGKCVGQALNPTDHAVNLPGLASEDKSTCDTDGTHCSQETCADGTCTFVSFLDPCGCATTKDCAALEDNTVCNGTMYCNKATKTCQVNPATVVHCPTFADGPCAAVQCHEKTGKCGFQQQPDGKACVDGSPCTVAAECSGGTCKMTQTKCACSVNADCAQHAAAIVDKCVGTQLFCDKSIGACVLNPASKPVCLVDKDTTCLKNRCDSKTGTCQPVKSAENTLCEADGSACTAPDQCKSGTCVAPKSVCKCGSDKDCSAYDDGDPCNGTLICDKSTGGPSTWRCEVNVASQVVCQPGTPCKPLICDPADGQCKTKQRPDGYPCEADGSKCSAEQCNAGVCSVVSNVCQCPTGDDCAAFEDGNPCNGTLFCDKTGDKSQWACKVNPASVVLCDGTDNSVCQHNVCDPKTGVCALQPLHEDQACIDDDACTLHEQCNNGTCLSPPTAATKTCNDGNGCTVDSCNKTKGCVFAGADGADCDDNNACTVGESCVGAVCQPGLGDGNKLVCNDDGNCKATGCDPKTGCLFTGAKVEVCDGKRNVCGGEIDAGCDDDQDGFCDANMAVELGATCTKTLAAQSSGCPLVWSETVDFSKGGRSLKLSQAEISQD